jgi:hypothetical protein
MRTALIGDQDVPTNARIPARTGTRRKDEPEAPPLLRRKGGEPVPCDTATIEVDGAELVELRPRQPLAPDTDYEIVVRWFRDEKKHSFRTGAGADDKPPEWDGILAAEYQPASSCDVSCFHRRDALIEIKVARARDERMGGEDVIYDIWIGKGGAAIDYGKPPDFLRSADGVEESMRGLGRQEHDYLTIGGAHHGGAPGALPRGARKLRLGLRPRDAAGNRGPTAETVVAIKGGIKPPDW